MRIAAFLVIAVASVLASAVQAADAEHPVIRLWSGKAPGEQAPVASEKVDRSSAAVIERVTNVSEPTLTVFQPPSDKRSGAAIIIAPGGAYQFLSWSLEGEEIARWFNGVGVTAFILKYRVPTRAADPGNRLALMDAQRSVSLVRSRAKEWGVDPARIGFLGFSAGGHLGANLENNPEPRAYDAADDADRVSCRPDFVVLIYPGALVKRDAPTELAPEMRLSKNTPPTFIAGAADDKGTVGGSITYFQALQAAGIPSELHIYQGGGHGFGIRSRAGVTATWPARVADWLGTLHLLPAGAGAR